MSRKKISTTIYVTPEQSERLRLLHERTKVPVAVYIREGIDLVLRQYSHLLPGQLALGAEASSPAAAPAPDQRAPPPKGERSDRGSLGSVTSVSTVAPSTEAAPDRVAGVVGSKS
jgi:hypothetical protein